MNSNTWKQGEERIARRFGTHRTPLSGGNSRHTRSDTLHNKLFIEVKHRKEFPQPSLWKESVEIAKKENKIPALVFLKKNDSNPLILCRLDDIEEIARLKEEARYKDMKITSIPPTNENVKTPAQIIREMEEKGHNIPKEFKDTEN